MPNFTDQEARDLARTAIAQIKSHELVCEQVRFRVDESLKRQERFEGRLWTIGGTAYGVLLGMLAFMTIKVLHL